MRLQVSVPVKVVSERLSQVAFTMNIYHVLPGTQAEAAETFAWRVTRRMPAAGIEEDV